MLGHSTHGTTTVCKRQRQRVHRREPHGGWQGVRGQAEGGEGGGGGLGPKRLCTKNGPTRFSLL